MTARGLWLAALLLAAQAAQAREVTLADVKAGRKFEVLEKLSVQVPPLLALLGELPPVEMTEGKIGLGRSDGAGGPVCVVSGLRLDSGALELPKGSAIDVESAGAVASSDPAYAGKRVDLSVRAEGSALHARLRCYSGRGSRGAMPIEVFEKIFRRKVRLLSKG